jgi:hypothetical protein
MATSLLDRYRPTPILSPVVIILNKYRIFLSQHT